MSRQRDPNGIRAYARHRRCDPMAVEKALKSGRITLDANGKIDFEKADRDWAQNTTPKAPASGRPPASNIPGSNTGPPDLDEPGLGAAQYTKARAWREYYLARLAKMEYEKLSGSLVSKEEVQAAAFNKYRRIRELILNVPDRISALLAVESDTKKIHELLSAELRRALHESNTSDTYRPRDL